MVPDTQSCYGSNLADDAVCNAIDVSLDGTACIAAQCEYSPGYKISTQVEYEVIDDAINGDKLIIDSQGCNIQYADMDRSTPQLNIRTSIQNYDDALIIKKRTEPDPNNNNSGYDWGNINDKIMGIKSKTQCSPGYAHGQCRPKVPGQAQDLCSADAMQNNRPLCESSELDCEYIPSYDNYSLYQTRSGGDVNSGGIPIQHTNNTFKFKDDDGAATCLAIGDTGSSVGDDCNANAACTYDAINSVCETSMDTDTGICTDNIEGHTDCSTTYHDMDSCQAAKVAPPSPPVAVEDGPRAAAIRSRIVVENHEAAFESSKQQLIIYGYDPNTPEGLLIINELGQRSLYTTGITSRDRNHIIAAQNYYAEEQAVRDSDAIASAAEEALPQLGPVMGLLTTQLFRAAHHIQSAVTTLVQEDEIADIIWPSEDAAASPLINQCSWVSHKELDLGLSPHYCSNDCYVDKDGGETEEQLLPDLMNKSIVLNHDNAVSWAMVRETALPLYTDPLCEHINDDDSVCLKRVTETEDLVRCLLDEQSSTCSPVPSQMVGGLACEYVPAIDCAPGATVLADDTSSCQLTPSIDFGATEGSCAQLSTSTCTYVAGTANAAGDGWNTPDSCSSTCVTGTESCTSSHYEHNSSCNAIDISVDGSDCTAAPDCVYFDSFSCIGDLNSTRRAFKTNDATINSQSTHQCGGAWSGETRNLICSDGDDGVDCNATDWHQDRGGAGGGALPVLDTEDVSQDYRRFTYSNYSYIIPTGIDGRCVRQGTDTQTDCSQYNAYEDKDDCVANGCLYEDPIYISSTKTDSGVVVDSKQICSGGGDTFDIYSECQPKTCLQMASSFRCIGSEGYVQNQQTLQVKPPIQGVLINSASSEESAKMLHDIITETCCTPITCANNTGQDGILAATGSAGFQCSGSGAEAPDPYINVMYYIRFKIYIDIDELGAQQAPINIDGNSQSTDGGTTPGKKYYEILNNRADFQNKMIKAGKYACAALSGVTINGISNDTIKVGRVKYELGPDAVYYRPYVYVTIEDKKHSQQFRMQTGVEIVCNSSTETIAPGFDASGDPTGAVCNGAVCNVTQGDANNGLCSPILFPIPDPGTHSDSSDDLESTYKYAHSFMKGFDTSIKIDGGAVGVVTEPDAEQILTEQQKTLHATVLNFILVDNEQPSITELFPELPGITVRIIDEKAKYMGIECPSGSCDYSACCEIHTCQSYDKLYEDTDGTSICPDPTTPKWPAAGGEPGPYVVNLLCLEGTQKITLNSINITFTDTTPPTPPPLPDAGPGPYPVKSTPAEQEQFMKGLRKILKRDVERIMGNPSNINPITVSFGVKPNTGEWDGYSDDAIGIKVGPRESVTTDDGYISGNYTIAIYINSYKVHTESYTNLVNILQTKISTISECDHTLLPDPDCALSFGPEDRYKISYTGTTQAFITHSDAIKDDWDHAKCVDYTHYKTAAAARESGNTAELNTITNELSNTTCCEIKTCDTIELTGEAALAASREAYCSSIGTGELEFRPHATFIQGDDFANTCCLDEIVAYLPLDRDNWSDSMASSPDLYQYGSYVWDPHEPTVAGVKQERVFNAMARFGNTGEAARADPMVKTGAAAEPDRTAPDGVMDTTNIDKWDSFPGRLNLTEVEYDAVNNHYVHSEYYDDCDQAPKTTEGTPINCICGTGGTETDYRSDNQKIFDTFIEQVKCDNSDDGANPAGTPTGHIGARTAQSIAEVPPHVGDDLGQGRGKYDYPTLGITPLDISSYTDETDTGLYNSFKHALEYDISRPWCSVKSESGTCTDPAYTIESECGTAGGSWTPADADNAIQSAAKRKTCAEHNNINGGDGCLASGVCTWDPNGTTKMDEIDGLVDADAKHRENINFYYLNGCLSREEKMCRVPTLNERDISRYAISLSNVHGIASLISAGELTRDISHHSTYGLACPQSAVNHMSERNDDPYPDLVQHHFNNSLPPGANQGNLDVCDTQFGDINISGCGSLNKNRGSMNIAAADGGGLKTINAYIQEPKAGEVLCGTNGVCETEYGGTCNMGEHDSATECQVDCDSLIPGSRSTGINRIASRANTAVQTWCTNRYDAKILNIDRFPTTDATSSRCDVTRTTRSLSTSVADKATQEEALCNNLANCAWNGTVCNQLDALGSTVNGEFIASVNTDGARAVNRQLCIGGGGHDHFFRTNTAEAGPIPGAASICSNIPTGHCEESGICMTGIDPQTNAPGCINRTPAPGDTALVTAPGLNNFSYDKCIPCTGETPSEGIGWPTMGAVGRNTLANIYKTGECGAASEEDLGMEPNIEFRDNEYAYCLDTPTGTTKLTPGNERAGFSDRTGTVAGGTDGPQFKDYLNKYVECDGTGGSMRLNLAPAVNTRFFHQHDESGTTEDNTGECKSNECFTTNGGFAANCDDQDKRCADYIDNVAPDGANMDDATKKLLCETHTPERCYWKNGTTNDRTDVDKKNWKKADEFIPSSPGVASPDTANVFTYSPALNEIQYNTYYRNIAILNSMNSRKQVCIPDADDTTETEIQPSLSGLSTQERVYFNNQYRGDGGIRDATTKMCIEGDGGALDASAGAPMSFAPLINGQLPSDVHTTHPLNGVMLQGLTPEYITGGGISYDANGVRNANSVNVNYGSVFNTRVIDDALNTTPGPYDTLGKISNAMDLPATDPGHLGPVQGNNQDICEVNHFLMMGSVDETIECVKCGQIGSSLEGYQIHSDGNCRRTFCQCDVHASGDDDTYQYKMVNQADPHFNIYDDKMTTDPLTGAITYNVVNSMSNDSADITATDHASVRYHNRLWSPGENCARALRMLAISRAGQTNNNMDSHQQHTPESGKIGHRQSGSVPADTFDRITVCDAQEPFEGPGTGFVTPNGQPLINRASGNIPNVYSTSVCMGKGKSSTRYKNVRVENDSVKCHQRDGNQNNCFPGLAANFFGAGEYKVETCGIDVNYAGTTSGFDGNLQKRCSHNSECLVGGARTGIRCDFGPGSHLSALKIAGTENTTPSTLVRSPAPSGPNDEGYHRAYKKEGTCTLTPSSGSATPGSNCEGWGQSVDMEDGGQGTGYEICGRGAHCDYEYGGGDNFCST